MPEKWSDKDERQFIKVLKSLLAQGKTPDEAKEIAGRVVNKQRRKEGRTPNRTTQGTGNPHIRLEKRTRDELYNRAAELNISGRSKMNKARLIDAIRSKQ